MYNISTVQQGISFDRLVALGAYSDICHHAGDGGRANGRKRK
jgi:hypothetical protein